MAKGNGFIINDCIGKNINGLHLLLLQGEINDSYSKD